MLLLIETLMHSSPKFNKKRASIQKDVIVKNQDVLKNIVNVIKVVLLALIFVYVMDAKTVKVKILKKEKKLYAKKMKKK